VVGQMLKKEYRDQAVAEVNRALAVDPKPPSAHFLLGEIDIARGRPEEALGA
jgi:lipopolysaccharide biosynthesis regulator YciM